MNIGEEILKLLKEEISAVEYNRYIKQLEFDLENYKSDMALFYAPNPLIANWVKTKYSHIISHLFEIKTGVKPLISLQVKKKSKVAEQGLSVPLPQQPKAPSGQSLLNPSFTFENFVVGSSNQFAYTASLSVAKKPGESYNPLFLYGGVGLGKTHLAQAIGNFHQNDESKIIFTTVEQFINDFTRHLKNQTMDRFKEKYRKCDILIIDDIQFLSGKTSTQEEFFHTFNELKAQFKQIVLTADKPPKQIVGLEERLKSRFESGLIANIEPPELETKIAIIQKKCELNRIYLDKEIIDYIATIIDNNAREIEGILQKLHAHSTLMNQHISLEFTKDVLKEQIKEKNENITIESIIELVAMECNIKPSEIRSKSRSRNIVYARRIAIYLARTLTPNSMPQLAQYFSMKDHTAVSHTMKKINELLKSDANFKIRLEELTNKMTVSTKNP